MEARDEEFEDQIRELAGGEGRGGAPALGYRGRRRGDRRRGGCRHMKERGASLHGELLERGADIYR